VRVSDVYGGPSGGPKKVSKSPSPYARKTAKGPVPPSPYGQKSLAGTFTKKDSLGGSARRGSESVKKLSSPTKLHPYQQE